ncbi:MAG: hypothetical protein IKL40_05655, partial [Clostridia bacterium]|nr:hypothetical protein [Clostridia bacterium]
MKMKRIICLALVLCMLTLIGCQSTETIDNTDNTDVNTTQENTETKDTTTEENEEPPMKTNYSILFIGNSYTYYNDMPTIFKNLGQSAGYTLDVDSITKGSHKLSQFADPSDEYGKKVEQALTGTKKYDYVVVFVLLVAASLVLIARSSYYQGSRLVVWANGVAGGW